MIRGLLHFVPHAFALLAASVAIAAGEPQLDPRLAEAEQVYRTQGPETALPQFSRLLDVFELAGESRNIALTHGFLGACHWRLGNYDDARVHLDQALALNRKSGDQLQAGKNLNLLGLLEWDLGNFDAAVAHFGQAGAIGAQERDSRLQGASLNNLSLVYDELGDYERSLKQYLQVLEIYSATDFPRGVGDTLGNIGGVYLLLGRFTEAERYYQKALEMSRQLQSVSAMSQDHGNLGLAHTGLGNTREALRHFDLALDLAGQAGLKKERGQWLRGKANVQIMAGMYDQGLENHRAALELLQSLGARGQLLDALHDMGELHLTLGDPVSAEQYFQRARHLADTLGIPRAVTLNLLSLGDLEYRRLRPEAAMALYTQALQRGAAAGEKTHQGWALLRLARIHQDQERLDQAEQLTQQAIEVSRVNGARAIEAEGMLMQAELEHAKGNTGPALLAFEQAGAISEQLGDPELEWQVQFGRGMALEQAGRLQDAVAALLEAVEIIESVRSRLQERRYRTGYLQDKHQVYIELVRLQMELSRPDEAFDTAERLRTWTFTEQSGLVEPDSLDEPERQALAELRERIRQLQRNLEFERSRQAPEQRQLAIETFSNELLLAEREFQARLDDLASAGAQQPYTAPRVPSSDIRSQLLPSEALLEYVVGADAITVFALTVSGIHAINVPATRPDLHSRLELLRQLLLKPDSERWQSPARSLSGTLLQPLITAGWLQGIEHLYLVPHGMLNYLPFALLPITLESSQVPLVEPFTLAYLPSASALITRAAPRRQAQSLLALAPEVSGLAHAPEEVRSIGALFEPHAQLLLGKSATESTFKATAGQHGILHLATHGYFNKLNPLLSGLQLEADADNDGLLEVHEILEMKLDSTLVTLSACKTGLGSGYFSTLPAGDDFIGMTRAFLQVGSASVLATLWEVEDRSTVDLMSAFYGELGAGSIGHNKAGALAQAQRAMLASPNYGHPYYWAPFILVGPIDHGSTTHG